MVKLNNGLEVPSYGWYISLLQNLIISLYEDIVESDECGTSYYVEKYARQIKDLGIDIGYIGLEQLFDTIRLNDKLEKQYSDSRLDDANKYAAKSANLRTLANYLGWNIMDKE